MSISKVVPRPLRNGLRKVCHLFGVDIVWLKNVPKETLMGLRDRSFGTIIDCGANNGQFARYISRFFPTATLYCFEPLKEPFTILSEWAATQGGRVNCIRTALGDSEGEGIMHHHVEHSPSSSLLSTTPHETAMFPQTLEQSDVAVAVTTLDSVLANTLEEMAPDILLKLDVQGYEDRVLRGAARTLSKVQVCVLEVNVDPMYEAQASFNELVMLLHQSGFTYAGNMEQCCGDDGRVMWLDAVFRR